MKRALLHVLALLAIGLATSGAAQEGGQTEVPRGTWQTEPDMIGVSLLVRTRACGRNLCGRVLRAKNRGGYDAPSGAVGQKAFWELKPQPDGSFYGEYRDAQAQRFSKSRVEVSGRKMRLRVCDEDSCMDQVWTLVK